MVGIFLPFNKTFPSKHFFVVKTVENTDNDVESHSKGGKIIYKHFYKA